MLLGIPVATWIFVGVIAIAATSLCPFIASVHLKSAWS